MKEIAFLTLEDPSSFVIYDSLVIPYFKSIGLSVTEIPWTQKKNWSLFDLVIIRSTWDYQSNWKEFISVLRTIQQQTTLANPLPVVLWNYQKKYLIELQNQAFASIDTYIPEHELTVVEWERLQQKWNAPRLVIKPQISANADDTYVLHSYKDYLTVKPIFDKKPFLLQPYLAEIETEGEISLFYFNGNYSHAVKKKPKHGDFRVQEEHGGIITPVKPQSDLIEIANQVSDYLSKQFETLLYARLDFVKQQEQWKIMELELIEPSLYFPYHPNACQNFVEATFAWYQNKVSMKTKN
ncbi:MAG: hypothetical protein NZ108_03695 [Bacteroidia bacterium]|nr:hypothetical protein [Bacteroidia bacterium]